MAVLPGPIYYPVLNESRLNTVRVSFGDNAPERLREACRRLGLALNALRRKTFVPSGTPVITVV